MKKRYKWILVLLIFLFISLITTGIGVTYAYYRQTVTGAVATRTSDYTGEIEVVSETHSILPASGVAVDEIKFYVKNYTGADNTPTNSSEVYLSYDLTFSLQTNWGSGCANPISYELVPVNQSDNTEGTPIQLTSNHTSQIDFSLISAEKDYYKLKLYWDMTKNGASCYAGKSGTVGIAANLYQTPARYNVN